MSQLKWPEEPLPAWLGEHRVIAPLSVGRATDVLLAVTRGPHGFSRPVVLKRVRPENARDPAHLRSLAREAMAYARLSHPSIVRLYDFAEEDGHCFMVLEYVPGMSLRELVAHLHVVGDVMQDEVALYVMAQVFAGLAAAHAARDPATGEFASIIHRDVSPKNVLLDWDGGVKLADFGIAKLAGVASDTRSGLLKGTYGYMAPEQVLSDPTTVRTDVYAACLLLRELLLGRRTFVRGQTPELEFLQMMAAPELPPVEALRSGVPERVCRALDLGLQVLPDRRDIAASELRDILLDAVNVQDARQKLAAQLQELRPTENVPSREQGETTEPHSWQGSPMQSEGDRSEPQREPFEGPISGMRVREARVIHQQPTVPDLSAGPVTVRVPPSPTAAALAQVPTLPSAFRVQAASLRWRRLTGRNWRRAALACFAVLVLGAVVLASRARRGGAARESGVTPRASGPASGATAPLLPTPPKASENATAVTAFAPGAPPSTTGLLTTTTRSHDHRIYVDGQVVGATGETLPIRCGPHKARYGSKGRWQAIDVPCGGKLTLEPSW